MGRGGGHSSGGSHGGGHGHSHYSSSRGGGSSSRSYHSSGSRSYHSHSYYGGVCSPRVGGSVTGFIFILAILVFAFMWITLSSGRIQKSTHERTKLAASDCNTISEWYTDDLGWIHDTDTLNRGLKDFYDKTGVQPYLYITDNIDGSKKPADVEFERKLKLMYEQLFTDEGHVIVCFLESSPSDYATYYWAGSKAKQVLDYEGGEILLDYLDYYYTSDDLSDEEFFAKAFTKSADRMMTVQKTTKQLSIVFAIVAMTVGGIIGTSFYFFKKKKEARLQAEADAKILNTKIKEED